MSSKACRCHTAIPGVYQLAYGKLTMLPPNRSMIVRSAPFTRGSRPPRR